MKPSRKMLIVFHSQSGNTKKLALAVERGALKIPGTDVAAKTASSVNSGDLMECDVFVVCSPEYFGYMAGAVKDLFDRTYEEVRPNMSGKSYCLVVSAGNDGSGAVNSMERIISGFKMKKIQETLIFKGNIGVAYLESCLQLGETVAAGMDLGIY